MEQTEANPWDRRYSGDTYIYGTRPNTWLTEILSEPLPLDYPADTGRPLRALEAAGGEGRNAVYLAERGFSVTAVDVSRVGTEKTLALAERRGVTVNAICADALAWRPQTPFDLVVTTSFHVPENQKTALFRALDAAVRPGGVLIAEWFHPEQRTQGFTSGGPPYPEMMFTLDEIRRGLTRFTFERLEHTEKELREGPKHDGPASVVSVLARKRV